jgi:hypothetical protein
MAGLAAPAFAQDSTSRNSDGGGGLPGDAMDAYSTVLQKKNYVATLSPITTSQGTTFGIVPLIKGSKACSVFFNNLISAQSISQTILNDIDATGTNYLTWGAPQQGAHPTENAPGAISVSGPFGKQFGVTFNEGSGGTACLPSTESQDNVITGIVNFDPAAPAKMYVQRVVAGVNKANNTAGTLNVGSLAVGGVDASGFTAIRGDNFGSSSVAPNRISGNNYYLVDAAARNGAVVNQLNSLGGSDVTIRPLNASTTTHSTPSLIPSDLTGSAVVVTGSNFSKQYTYQTSPTAMTTTLAHLGALADIRGGVAFSQKVIFPGSVGTNCILAKTTTAGAALTDSISIWGVDAAGAVTGQRTFTAPTNISDTCDTFTISGWDFDGYHSQVNAQGGNGCAAVGKDQYGNGLVAGTLYDNTTWNNFIVSVLGAPSTVWDNANPYNAIAVGRFDPNSAAPAQWKLAAWVNFDTVTLTSTGKPILDSTGTPIGRVCSFWDVHQDPARQYQWGPDFSQPVIDSAGNIWFMSYVELFNRLPGGGSDFDAALVRAVYDPDQFCYTLDLVLEVGQQITGSDSTVKYQINFLDIVDGDGTSGTGDPSNSSGTIFTNNGLQAAWANVNNTALPASYPQNLGGLVIGAKIIYDVNNDGQYNDPTSGGGNPASTDEGYNALMYIGNIKYCPADVTGDGLIDLGDFFQFFNDFDQNLLGADINGDLSVDLIDFFQFLNSFDQGC